MRILGVDYGTKKIGLAMGESVSRVAAPMEVWRQEGEEATAKALARFAEKEGVEMIVVGVPRKSTGELTEQGKLHQSFVEHLRSLTPVPVVTVDESFTSKESQRLQKDLGTDVSEDALAAMLIVEEYFSSTS